MAWPPERLIDEVDLLGARDCRRKEFFAELAPRLRNVIDNDASCWHTLDPHTRLMTSDSPDELIERGVFAPDEAPAAGELLVRSEYLVEDVNTFAGLAARRVPSGSWTTSRAATRSAALAIATCSSRPTSPRAAPPSSSAAARLGPRCTSPPRCQRTVRAARRPRPRRRRGRDRQGSARRCASMRHAAGRASRRRGSSCSVHGTRVRLITPPARGLLASMRPDRPAYADDAMPTPVLALASFVRGAPGAGQGGSNVVTVPGSDGWITLHASLPGPPGDRRVAIVLERAAGAARRPSSSRHSARPLASARSPPSSPAACREQRWPRR